MEHQTTPEPADGPAPTSPETGSTGSGPSSTQTTPPRFDPEPPSLFPWLDLALRLAGTGAFLFAVIAAASAIPAGPDPESVAAAGGFAGAALSCALGRVLIRATTELHELRKTISERD